MSYLSPDKFMQKVLDAGAEKVHMRKLNVLIRAFMAGALLGIAAVFAVTIANQTGIPIVGAALFPVGFCMIYLMGFDLLTGVFVLTPLAYLDGRNGVTLTKILYHWLTVFCGNFLGALVIAFLTSVFFTFSFTTAPDSVGTTISVIGENRTLGYKSHGLAGMITVFVRAILCNWMVSLGVIGAMVSSSVSGKVIAMWMPIMLFFGMGFEHSVVNMYLFPAALLLGGKFSLLDYLLWNEFPVIFGNLVGGLLLTGLPLYYTHKMSFRAAD